MFENVIKGGIKPGMILTKDHPTKMDKYNKWIVFPNSNNEMCAVCYGEYNWTRIRQEADKLYLGSFQCLSIFAPPTSCICANADLIWSSERGIVKPEYKPDSLDDSLDVLLANLDLGDKSGPIDGIKNSEETPTQYFY